MCVAQTSCDAIFNKSLPRILHRDEDHPHCFPVADFFLADVLDPRFERLPDQLPITIVPFTQSGQRHLFSDMDGYLHFGE